jgi:ribosomal protein S20
MKIMDKLKTVIKNFSKISEEEGAKNTLQKAYSSLKNMGSFT